jgi:hypothetical protein
MSVLSVLDTRVGFEAALGFVTWAAIAFLAVIAMHLHLRLQRLESASLAARGSRPFGQFAGVRIDQVLGVEVATRPDTVIALSGSCSSCDRVLAELASPDWRATTLIFWTDFMPSTLPSLPACVRVLPNGKELAAKLGIHITPFAMWVDEHGVITKAQPVNTLRNAVAAGNGAVKV